MALALHRFPFEFLFHSDLLSEAATAGVLQTCLQMRSEMNNRLSVIWWKHRTGMPTWAPELFIYTFIYVSVYLWKIPMATAWPHHRRCMPVIGLQRFFSWWKGQSFLRFQGYPGKWALVSEHTKRWRKRRKEKKKNYEDLWKINTRIVIHLHSPKAICRHKTQSGNHFYNNQCVAAIWMIW